MGFAAASAGVLMITLYLIRVVYTPVPKRAN